MRRKKLLSAVVGMTMLLQLCVPVNASDEAVILTEETVVQTEQAGGEVTEQTGSVRCRSDGADRERQAQK